MATVKAGLDLKTNGQTNFDRREAPVTVFRPQRIAGRQMMTLVASYTSWQSLVWGVEKEGSEERRKAVRGMIRSVHLSQEVKCRCCTDICVPLPFALESSTVVLMKR